MDCADFLFHLLDTIAYYVAAAGACAAAVFAYRTFRAQEQQVHTQQAQLELLSHQHIQFLNTQERERRVNGPDFVVAPEFDFSGIKAASALIDPSQEAVIPQKANPNSITALAAAQDGKRMYLLLENKNPSAVLKGWITSQPEQFDGFEVIGLAPCRLNGSSSGDPTTLWLLSYEINTDALQQQRRAQFQIQFETTTGFVDRQTYEVVAGHPAIRRVDPTGYKDA